MSGWRYFLDVQASRARLMRLRLDEPLLCAELLYGDGTWRRNDRLFKQIMLGSDGDLEEVDEQRFAEALAKRVVTSDESINRPSVAELARLTAVERQISDRWKAVPIPPGAGNISFPTRENPSGQ